MKRTIYVAIADKINGDSFDLIVTFDVAEARNAIEKDIYYSTEREKKLYTYWIDSRCVEVDDGESASDAYRRLTLDDEWYDSDVN